MARDLTAFIQPFASSFDLTTIRGEEGEAMRSMWKDFARLLLAGALATPVLMTGCTVHARYYDPYYRDYHPVSGGLVFYGQWERDTHREHRELRERREEEKKEYWEWRHHHEDH